MPDLVWFDLQAGDALHADMQLATPPRQLYETSAGMDGAAGAGAGLGAGSAGSVADVTVDVAHSDHRFVALETCCLMTVAGVDFERHLRQSSNGIVLPFASSYAALSRSPKERTSGDLLLLMALVNTVGGIFTSIPQEKRWMLCRSFELQELPRNRAVCLQGTPGDTFYIVLTGAIAIHHRSERGFVAPSPPEGKSIHDPEIDYGRCDIVLPAGVAFGEKSLLFGAPRTTTCITADFSQLIALNKEAFELVANEDLVLTPWLSYEILRTPVADRAPSAMHYLNNFCRTLRLLRSTDIVSEATLWHVLMPGLGYRAFHREGEPMFVEGNDNGNVYVVLAGAVDLYVATDSAGGATPGASHSKGAPAAAGEDNEAKLRESYGQRVATLVEGDFFGEYHLGQINRKRTYTAVAAKTSLPTAECSRSFIVAEVLVIDHDTYVAWLESEQRSTETEGGGLHLRNRTHELIRMEQCRRVLLRKTEEFRTRADHDLIREMIEVQPFIAQLPEANVVALAKTVTMRVVPANGLIFDQGDKGDCLYMILRGSVNLFRRTEETTAWLLAAKARAEAGTSRGSGASKNGGPAITAALAKVNAVEAPTSAVVDVESSEHAGVGAAFESTPRTSGRVLAEKEEASVVEVVGDDSGSVTNEQDVAQQLQEMAVNMSLNGADHRAVSSAIPQIEINAMGTIHAQYGELISIQRDGDAFGESALRTGDPRSAAVIAREPTELLCIRKHDFDSIVALLGDKGGSGAVSLFRPSELKRKLNAIEEHIETLTNVKNPTHAQQDELEKAVLLKRSTLQSILRPLSVFKDLADDEFGAIASRMRALSFNAGEPVFAFDQNPSWVGILVLGSIEVSDGLHPNDVLHKVHVGEQFGHLPIVWGLSGHFAEARATKETLVIVMPRAVYTRRWMGVRDTSIVDRARFLRELTPLAPLPFRNLAAIDMTCTKRVLPRGAITPSDLMGTRLYAIYSGECKLLLVPAAGRRSANAWAQAPGHKLRAMTAAAAGSSGNDQTSAAALAMSIAATEEALPSSSSGGGARDARLSAPAGGAGSGSSNGGVGVASPPLAYVGRRTVFGDFGIISGGEWTLALQCTSEVTVIDFDSEIVMQATGRGEEAMALLKEALACIVCHRIHGVTDEFFEVRKETDPSGDNDGKDGGGGSAFSSLVPIVHRAAVRGLGVGDILGALNDNSTDDPDAPVEHLEQHGSPRSLEPVKALATHAGAAAGKDLQGVGVDTTIAGRMSTHDARRLVYRDIKTFRKISTSSGQRRESSTGGGGDGAPTGSDNADDLRAAAAR